MRLILLMIQIVLFTPTSFASVAVCEPIFDDYYQSYRRAYNRDDSQRMRALEKEIEDEHIRIVQSHNQKVTELGQGYYLYPMNSEYIGENIYHDSSFTDHVNYFSQDELDASKITVVNGLLYRGHELLTTSDRDSMKVDDWVFVMDADGDIYIFKGIVDEIHHSSALNGRPLAAAGTIRVLDGQIDILSTQTGHYLDETAKFILQFEAELSKRGVDISLYGRDFQLGTNAKFAAELAVSLYKIPREFFIGLI